MELKIKGTIVFNQNWNALHSDKRFIINEGGSRSSKTVSLCQLIILYALQNPNKVVSIVRKTFPSIRATVMRDFFDVMKELNIYSKDSHNMTEHIYYFPNGSMVEFFSVDDEQKIRGRKRDLCWCNEANELFYDDFSQLNMRTVEKMIFDYNPSESLSWLYELDHNQSIVIKSTYKDNPFLPEAIRKQIEDFKRTDPDMYAIYALGQRVSSKANVYQGWEFVEEKPIRFEQYIYGLDFGYNHPTALIKVYFHEKDLYLEPVIYQSYLTLPDLISQMQELGVSKQVEIMADHARPEMIQEILGAGYNIYKANKEVKKGIDNVKTFKVYAKNDKHLRKEFENYKWKKVNDAMSEEPIKLHDDAMDAIRYAVAYIKSSYYSGSTYDTL
jgi:phage terminase large subunit